MKQTITLLLVVIVSSITIAQTAQHCGSVEQDLYQKANYPNYESNRQFIEDFTNKYIQKNGGTGNRGGSTVITIPVVVHVLFATSAENITDAQIISQLDVINEDFRRLNADASETPSEFETVAADFEIEFCLANNDPVGGSTSGIHRVSTTTAEFGMGGDPVKFSSDGGTDAWPSSDYLNIWCCNLSPGLLGYAQFPGGDPETDGVVIDFRSFGRTGLVDPPYDLGRTATHEIGHWMNLYHIWGDDGDCSGSDFVDDTPNQEIAIYGCPTYPLADACDASIQFQNYMDYTDDLCYNMFTEGQKERARSIFEPGGSRYNLTLSTACIIAAYDAEVVEVITPQGNLCENSFNPLITIRNAGEEDLTSLDLLYSVDGASPITYVWIGSLATFESEEVTLPSLALGDGGHTFSVTAANPSGELDGNAANNEASSVFFINTVGLTIPLIQGFEDAVFPYAGYSISNPDESFTWEQTIAAAKIGVGSVFINQFENSAFGQADVMELPAYDLSGVTEAHLDFDVAYSGYSVDFEYSDTLQVLVSGDCGVTWNSIFAEGKEGLATAPATGAPFVPNQDQWRTESLSLNSYVGSKVTVQFRAVSQWENNIYLDNINIAAGAVGVFDDNTPYLPISIFPNPASDFVQVNITAQTTDQISIQMYTTTGQLVYSDFLQPSMGVNFFTLPIAQLPSGFYTIQLLNSNNFWSSHFIKL